MDVLSFSEASTANGRIEKFNTNPDSNSGIVTFPKVIEAGESVTVPAGRVAVLPNVQVDGTLNVEGEVFIPSGATFSKVVGTEGNQSIAGVKTFSLSPIVPTPSTGTQAANKDYVDDTSILNLSAKVDKAKDISGDIDLALTGGIYAYASSLSNLPAGAGVAGSLLVSQGTNTTARSQLLISINGDMFFRYGDSGGWNTWKQLVNKSDFVQSLATEGYQKLPSGLILQWGVTTSGISGTEIFPIAFPKECFGVQITNNSTNSSGFILTFSKTDFNWANANTVVNRYFAIGY